jgi:hypothetical protein
MSGGAGIRRAAAAALVAGLLAACQPTTVVVTRPPVPDQPANPDLLGQAVVVAQGNGELGQYRAWIYRTSRAETCFEIATQDMATTGCGPGVDGAVGISRTDTDGGWFVGGGTRQPAVTAVLRFADGREIRGPVAPAPPGVADGTSWFVIPVPGEPPTSVDLLDASGAVLETTEFEP